MMRPVVDIESAAQTLQNDLRSKTPESIMSVGIGIGLSLIVYARKGYRISKVPSMWEGYRVRVIKISPPVI